MKTAQRFFIISLIITILTAFYTNKSFASNILYSNDFELETLGAFPSGWTVDRNIQWSNYSQPCMNGGQAAKWQIGDYFGSKRVGISINGSGCVTEITPVNLEIPDLSNYQYEVDISFPNSVTKDRNIAFKYHNGGEWYGIKFVHPNNIEFQKVMAPTNYNSQLGNAVYSNGFQINQTYHLTTKIVNNLISFYVNDVLVKSVQDISPILNQGKIALQASIGSLGANTTYFDNVKVTDLSGPETLEVPLVSQDDPEWAEIKYDGLNKKVGQVGCALSSIAMVLNYHGYTTLPDGSPLNPETLNTWLGQEKVYGYTRNGYINFASIASLTNDVFTSTDPNVSHLEYTRFTPPNYSTIDDIITTKKDPIIFDQLKSGSNSGHHFTVGEGIIASGEKYAIKDPYDDQKIELDVDAEHVVSARYFEPQNTDFSYLMFQADEALNILLTNPDGVETGTTNGTTAVENIPNSSFVKEGTIYNSQTPGEEEGNPFWNLEVKYPSSGEYSLSLSAAVSGWYTFETYGYSKDGGVEVIKRTVFVSATVPTVLLLQYNEEGGNGFMSIKPKSFRSLIALILDLKARQQIQNKSADQLIAFVTTSEKVYNLSNFAGKNLLRVLKTHVANDVKQGKATATAKTDLYKEIDAYLEML